MNHLFIIGNGFDLAHGLPTKYEDFVFSYFADIIEKLENTGTHEDELFQVINNYQLVDFNREEFNTSSDLLEFMEKNHFDSINFRNGLFQDITTNLKSERWVDIEYLYYEKLKSIYLRERDKKATLQSVKALNSELVEIKRKFISYLDKIDYSNVTPNPNITSIIYPWGYKVRNDEEERVIYLNFNYTSTIKKYLEQDDFKYIINIHGRLGDRLEDIIFGYGDEMDPLYPEMENLNLNDYLNHIKSFGYFRNINYQILSTFLEGKDNDYEVLIMGHSCGISDRLLLNSIFENENCKSIQIYYHQKSKTENDYFVKTQEISRHFRLGKKGDMRNIIVPYKESRPLVPLN